MSEAPPLSVVIPAAGLGSRMGGKMPKALLLANARETVLARQLRLIRETFGLVETRVVLGHGAHRIKQTLPANTRIVINHDFEATNVAYSIALGLGFCKPGPVMVLFGDLVFGAAYLSPLVSAEESTVLVDSNGTMSEREVGVMLAEDGETVIHFSYGLPRKWGQAILLHERERSLFEQIMRHPNKAKAFCFEVLNDVLAAGGRLLAVEGADSVRDLDVPADLTN